MLLNALSFSYEDGADINEQYLAIQAELVKQAVLIAENRDEKN